MNDGRYDFDLERFKRAVGARADSRAFTADIDGDFLSPLLTRAVAEAMKPQPIVWKDEPYLARRKLILEAERYGEEMHESRE